MLVILVKLRLTRSQIDTLEGLGYDYLTLFFSDETLERYLQLIVQGHADALRLTETMDHSQELLSLMSLPIREFMANSLSLKIPRPTMSNIRIIAKIIGAAMEEVRYQVMDDKRIFLPTDGVKALSIRQLREELDIDVENVTAMRNLRWFLSILLSMNYISLEEGNLDDDGAMIHVRYSVLDPVNNMQKIIVNRLDGNQNVLPWLIWNKCINYLLMKSEFSSIAGQLLKHYNNVVYPMNIAIFTIETTKEYAGVSSQELIKDRIEAARILTSPIKRFLGIGNGKAVSPSDAIKYRHALQWPSNISFLMGMDVWMPARILVDVIQTAQLFVRALLVKEGISEIELTNEVRSRLRFVRAKDLKPRKIKEKIKTKT